MPKIAEKKGKGAGKIGAGVSFKPKNIVGKLLTSLPERSRIVLESRFGLGKNQKRHDW